MCIRDSTYTAVGADDAAAIATGLSGSTSTDYAFSVSGDVLTVTRSDGVEFAVSAGVASDGTAASDAVVETTNGSEAGAGSVYTVSNDISAEIGQLQTQIGTASVFDENGNVTTAGDGLTGLLEEAQSLETISSDFVTAVGTADSITETVTLTSSVENYVSVATLKSDAADAASDSTTLSSAANSADDITLSLIHI